MRNTLKKLTSIFLISLLVFSINLPIFASDTTVLAQSDLRSSKFIGSYTIWIDNEGGGKLTVSSAVYAPLYVENLEIQSLVLQQLVGVKWTTVATWSEKCTNAYFAGISKSYQGTIGGYYRVIGTYYAQNGGVSETKTLTSDSIYAVQ